MPTYKNVNGAYFQDNNGTLSAVSDPNTLRQLQAGTIGSSAGALGSSQVSPPKPISLSTITQPQQPVNLPVYQEPNVPNPQAAIPLPTAEQTPQGTQLEAQQTDLTGQVQSLFEKKGLAPGRKAELEQQAGLPALNTQVNEIYNQIRTLNASAFQQTQDAEGRLAPTFAIRGEQAQVQRQLSARTYGLAAAAEAIQGNIALAQDNVQRALDAEFGSIEAELEYKMFALQQVQQNLDREERRADKNLQIKLDERNRILQQQQLQIQNQREDKSIIMGWVAEAAKLGNAPTPVINQALSAGSTEQVLSILSPYLSDPNEKEAALLDLAFRREQIKNAQFDRYLAGEKFEFDKTISLATLQSQADASAGKSDETVQTRLNAIELANGLIEDIGARLSNGFLLNTPGNAPTTNQLNQLRGILALENRSKLKGSGQISDYESKVLNQAASALGEGGTIRASNLFNKDLASELSKVRAVLTVMNGGQTNVLMRNPQTGETQQVTVNREGLNQAVQDGMVILYQ